MSLSPNLQTNTVTITAGGDKTFADLVRSIPESGTIGYQFVDVDLALDMEISIQISYDGTNWAIISDAVKDPVTATLLKGLTPKDTLIFSLSDIPLGAQIRPLFVTNTTGDIVVTDIK